MFDLIYKTDLHQLMVSTQLTATKTDMSVLDLGAAGIQGKPVGAVYFVFNVDAIAAADSSNYFTFNLWHSDAITSPTALDGGVLVTPTTGLLNAAAPTVKATTLTTQAEKFVIVGYRGIKRYVQMQPTETNTSDITGSVFAVLGHLDSEHGLKLD